MVELGSSDECNHNIDAPCKRFQNISMKVITYLSAETDGKTTYENVCNLHLWLGTSPNPCYNTTTNGSCDIEDL